MRTSSEFWGNSVPVCPYCKVHADVEASQYDGDEREVQCDNCEKTFHVETVHQITFSTAGDCAKNKQMPHQLKLGWPPEHAPYACLNCKREYYDWELSNGRRPRLKEGEYSIIPHEKEAAI